MLLLVLVTLGCSTSKKYTSSTFSIDRKKYNRFIADQSAKDSRGETTGCLTRGKLDLHLEFVNSDTIQGLLLDSKTKEAIPFAEVLLYREAERGAESCITTAAGRFRFSRNPVPIKIVVPYTGFDTLEVSLERFSW
jgi:hypothetical protein